MDKKTLIGVAIMAAGFVLLARKGASAQKSTVVDNRGNVKVPITNLNDLKPVLIKK